MFIDVHCHLDLLKNIDKIINNAVKNNVKIILDAGVNISTNRRAIELSSKYPEIRAALGLYPIDTLSMTEKEIDEEIEFIKENKNKIIAVGDVGLDYKESERKEERERQGRIFEKFIRLALELDKPLIIHSRKAEKECIDILEKMGGKESYYALLFRQF